MGELPVTGSRWSTRFPVLTVNISAITLAQASAVVTQWVTQRQRTYINVCTTHTVLECYDAPALREIINHAGLATPDGMPLVWLGRLHKHTVGRVYGPDLMLLLCEQGQSLGWRHFFYGGAEGVPALLAENLKRRFPDLQIAGCYSPPFRNLTLEEEQDITQMINASKADIVWVGLGTPKQDYWVARFRHFLDAPLLIAVGAAFDFHSGRIKQAPLWMQRNGLEWLFRLSQDPHRLWKRYLLGNPRFVYLVVRHWLRGRIAGI